MYVYFLMFSPFYIHTFIHLYIIMYIPMYVYTTVPTFQPHSMYLPIFFVFFAGNAIRFENESYRTTESVGNFTEVRLVADQPFAENTSVNISFEDISATGVCSLLATITIAHFHSF